MKHRYKNKTLKNSSTKKSKEEIERLEKVDQIIDIMKETIVAVGVNVELL